MKSRIDSEGNLAVVDPGFDSLELLQTIYPEYEISMAELPGFTSPRFLLTRNMGSSVSDLTELSEDNLWDIHDSVMAEPPTGILSVASASILDLKIELARRILSHCHLCAHRCGVDRIQGETGICGLGAQATVANAFVHIAEEPPINPSLLISLAGCGLRCRYCQQWELLDPAISGESLEASLWHRLPTDGARSLSFIGGNPDESLYAILCFLADAPDDWSLPVVWNSNGYASPETVRLLEGIVDCYVPDFKYGSDDCTGKLSGAPGYPEAARETIRAMLSQGVPVIVRILALPGHFWCCNVPVLEMLAFMKSKHLYISVLGQYWPDWQITEADGEMARHITMDEVRQVHDLACKLGLQIIE